MIFRYNSTPHIHPFGDNTVEKVKKTTTEVAPIAPVDDIGAAIAPEKEETDA